MCRLTAETDRVLVRVTSRHTASSDDERDDDQAEDGENLDEREPANIRDRRQVSPRVHANSEPFATRRHAPELGFTERSDSDKVKAADDHEPERDPHGDVDPSGAGPVVEDQCCGDDLGRDGDGPGVPASRKQSVAPHEKHRCVCGA